MPGRKSLDGKKGSNNKPNDEQHKAGSPIFDTADEGEHDSPSPKKGKAKK